MSKLSFCPVPPGPMPLFIGEPDADLMLQGTLRCDHASKQVGFVPADPLRPEFRHDRTTRNRISVWEVDAMMPRRQVIGLYEEVKPLLERLDAGVTIRLVDGAWARTDTQEATVAYECIDEALCVEAEALNWHFVPGATVLRPVATALLGSTRVDATVKYGRVDAQYLRMETEAEFEAKIEDMLAKMPAPEAANFRAMRINLETDLKPGDVIISPWDASRREKREYRAATAAARRALGITGVKAATPQFVLKALNTVRLPRP